MCAVCDKNVEQWSDTIWLNRAEAADYLKVHPETLRRIVRRGEIPRYKQGGRVMFLRVDLDEYLKPKPA